MHFGPDGYLYVGFGDGGSGGDPLGHGQNKNTLLGSMIRLDVDGASPYEVPADNPYVGASGADEIWAIGLRNPWRWSFDGDLLYIGDVGQGAREEIDIEPAGDGGVNYGWKLFEGDSCYSGSCSTAGLTFPAYDYSHSVGSSVTGGWVYQSDELIQLKGQYFYADFISGWIKSFEYEGGSVTNHQDWTSEFGNVGAVSAFGRDADGVVYVVTFSGSIYRISPA
ncbi:MAG: PQQ-dependent sugar dehydrogenase, partial [Acidimicrobiia bacterium]|nr:PQQ-dependent sugar dehydrogenase [Acidimicrobiia bacterium]